MATMYELTSDYMAVLDMANNPDIPPEVIADTLEGISGEIELKAENSAIIIKELESEMLKIKTEEIRLSSRRKAIENNIEVIKQRLYNAMKLTGKEKFKTALFNFTIGKNPVKLVIDDESLIPKKYYVKQEPKLDAAKLKEDLKAGAVRKYAHLEQGENLRIK